MVTFTKDIKNMCAGSMYIYLVLKLSLISESRREYGERDKNTYRVHMDLLQDLPLPQVHDTIPGENDHHRHQPSELSLHMGH